MAYATVPTVSAGDTIASSTWGNVIKGDVEYLLNGQPNSGYLSTTDTYAYASVTAALINANFSKSITSVSGRVLMLFGFQVSTSNSVGNSGSIYIYVDGASTATITQNYNTNSVMSYAHVHSVAAGAHTFELWWNTTGGLNMTLNTSTNAPVYFRVFEV